MTLKAIISQKLLPRANGDGRVLACELLYNTLAVANLIRDAKTHQLYSVVETGSREGMITMDQALKKLYKNGDITFEEAQACMRNPKDLTQ
jgi:twitching motility protein PilT